MSLMREVADELCKPEYMRELAEAYWKMEKARMERDLADFRRILFKKPWWERVLDKIIG